MTPVNADMLEHLLNKYQYDRDKTNFVVNGFRSGFDLGYRGPTKNIRQIAPNLKFHVGNRIVLWNKVMKEVKLKRYAGQ